ncbi:MAG TPA: LpqB family beta-propeller domain-containing protein [Nonomuraea sp.]|nr:LpqB family beta-propeller domain-containing protein [Nonomuraea sp.]
MTRTSRLWAAVALAAAVVLGGSGCTVIPVTGPYPVDDAGGGDPLSKPLQRMIATLPQPHWTPVETVKGLQAAMAAYPDDPATLLKYLTPEAQRSWTPSGAVTVLDDALDFQQNPVDADESARTVSLKGKLVAAIEEDDTYVPHSESWSRPFELVPAQGGGYRVRNLPDGLVLTKSDVERAYRATKLYYLNGNTQDRLVVDNVRLRLKPTKTYAQIILERLLKAPSAALRGAATSSFPGEATIESVRSGEDERVVINLSGSFDPLDLSSEHAIMAQIRYSLNNNDVAKGRGIDVMVDGELYSSYRPGSDQGWLDNGGGKPFYVSKGAVHYLTEKGPGGAVPGPAGEPREGYTDFAVSKQGTMIAAKTPTGIAVADLIPQGQWQEVILGAPGDLTAPSWHRDGSLWTFDRKNGVVLRYDPAGRRGPERVSAPGLEKLDVSDLRIARDGVRVVVVSGKDTVVQIGALTGAMLSNFRKLTYTQLGEEIQDVAWRDDEHVLVLVKGKAGRRLNEINVGDGEITEIPLQDKVEAVAALNERVLAEAEAGNGQGSKLLELNKDQGWTAKVDTDANSPLFPLG